MELPQGPLLQIKFWQGLRRDRGRVPKTTGDVYRDSWRNARCRIIASQPRAVSRHYGAPHLYVRIFRRSLAADLHAAQVPAEPIPDPQAGPVATAVISGVIGVCANRRTYDKEMPVVRMVSASFRRLRSCDGCNAKGCGSENSQGPGRSGHCAPRFLPSLLAFDFVRRLHF